MAKQVRHARLRLREDPRCTLYVMKRRCNDVEGRRIIPSTHIQHEIRTFSDHVNVLQGDGSDGIASPKVLEEHLGERDSVLKLLVFDIWRIHYDCNCKCDCPRFLMSHDPFARCRHDLRAASKERRVSVVQRL